MRARKLRSTGTKAKARVSNTPNSLSELKKQLEARTGELAEVRGHLSEALEQQTATSEVLRAVTGSPADLKPVFEAILTNARRLCEAKFGHLLIYDGERCRVAALHAAPSILCRSCRFVDGCCLQHRYERKNSDMELSRRATLRLHSGRSDWSASWASRSRSHELCARD
jgi:hypothetical protein